MNDRSKMQEFGTIAGIIIVVVMLLVGAVYFFQQRIEKQKEIQNMQAANDAAAAEFDLPSATTTVK